MHEAEQYLRNPTNPEELYVQYGGKKRRLFINERDGDIGITRPRSRNRGFVFSDWAGITEIFQPNPNAEAREKYRRDLRNTAKYIRQAAKATFTNPFIRKCLGADSAKSPYENNISTGNVIDGQLISLDTIAKFAPFEARMFRKALEQKTEYRSCRFSFSGHEGTLSVAIGPDENGYLQSGDVAGYFNKEHEGCLNGYYYLLINNNSFIGYDKS